MQITQRQIDVCNSPLRNKHIKIEVLDFDFQVLDTIETEVLGGNITVDANNDNRRGCSVEMIIPTEFDINRFIRTDTTNFIQYGGKIWIDRYLKIYEGIEGLRNGRGIEWFNRGIFVIDTPTQGFSSDFNTISFNGIDLMVRLSGERGGQLANLAITIPEFQDEARKVRTTLRGALVSVLLEYAQIENYIIDKNIDDERWKYLPFDIKVSAGDTVYDLLSALRDLVPDWEMFFDENGIFIFQPIPKGEEDFTVEISEAQVVDDTVTVDFNNVKNQVIVYGGLNTDLRYTDMVSYFPDTNELRLYYETFDWSDLMINSRICFKNLSEYNEFIINKLSIYVESGANFIPFATDIPLVEFENIQPEIPQLKLEPDDIYILRVLEGDTNTRGKLLGTNVVFDLFSRQQPKATAVDNNKDSPYYINKVLPTPNYYGGESASNGGAYKITINDEDSPVAELDDGAKITFMPNVLNKEYNFKINSERLPNPSVQNYSNITYGNNIYMTTSEQSFYKSTDNGNNWTKIEGMSAFYCKVIYWEKSPSEKYFVAVGNNFLRISTDTINWTNLSSGYNFPSGANPSSISISEDKSTVIVGFLPPYSGGLFQLTKDNGSFIGRLIPFLGGGTPQGSYGFFSSYNSGYMVDSTGRTYIYNKIDMSKEELWEQGTATASIGNTWEYAKSAATTRIRTKDIYGCNLLIGQSFVIEINSGYDWEIIFFNEDKKAVHTTATHFGWASHSPQAFTFDIDIRYFALLIKKTAGGEIFPSDISNAGLIISTSGYIGKLNITTGSCIGIYGNTTYRTFCVLCTKNIFLTPDPSSGVWLLADFSDKAIRLTSTFTGGDVCDGVIYIYGINVRGNFLLKQLHASILGVLGGFENINHSLFNGNSASLRVLSVAQGKNGLVALFRDDKAYDPNIGYFGYEVKEAIYTLLIYSSNNSNTPIASGEIVTKELDPLLYGKFSNDYTIQVVRYDKPNNRFIYEGFLNNYLQVNIGGEYDVIPSDELCGQRARYELYLHSNTNNAITLSTPTIYYLDVNKRIHYFNSYKNEAKGYDYYLIKGLTFPLKAGENMTINAIQLYEDNTPI